MNIQAIQQNLVLVLGVTSIALIFIMLYFWQMYNAFIVMQNQVKTDFSDVLIQLKRRASLIERLASLVKEYAKHESETFKQVAKARSAVDTSQSTKEAAKAENMLTDTLRSLFAVSESYPKLQANANYADLQSQLEETENLIAQYREQYNVTVQQYNNLIQVFPNLIPAAVFKFAEEDFFDTKS
jgi:LemA protein